MSQLDPSIGRYLASCEARGLSDLTIVSRRSHLSAFAAAVDKPPELVDADDVEDFFVGCIHLAPSTRRVRHQALHAFFVYLQRRGKVLANPTDLVDPVKIPRKRPTYYTPEQASRLVQNCHDPRTRLLASLLLRHGQRIHAVLRLCWASVDFERARILYPSAKNGPPLALALDVDTARRLRAWHALVEGDLVFPGYKGGSLSYRQACVGLQAACKASGLPWRGAHEFRRTCITTMLQMGAPLHVVSAQVAGHADVATTTKFYAGVDDTDVAAVIRGLPY